MIPLTDQQKKICQNPVKAIRQKCLDCSGWSYTEVEQCPLTECALYPFRFGKNPFRTKVVRNMTEEQKEELRQRLKAAREKRLNKQNEEHLYDESESESYEDES